MGVLLTPGVPYGDAYARRNIKRPAGFSLQNLGSGALLFIDGKEDSQFFGQNVTNLGSGTDGFNGDTVAVEPTLDTLEISADKAWDTFDAARRLTFPKDASLDWAGELTFVVIAKPNTVSGFHSIMGNRNSAGTRSQGHIYWSGNVAGEIGIHYMSHDVEGTYSYSPSWVGLNGGTQGSWGMWVVTREFPDASNARIRKYTNFGGFATPEQDSGNSLDARQRICSQADAGAFNVGLPGDSSGSGTRMHVRAIGVYGSVLSQADLETIEAHYQSEGLL